MANDIIAFQAGREARINNLPRDKRRNADWLEGWDMEEASAKECAEHEYLRQYDSDGMPW